MAICDSEGCAFAGSAKLEARESLPWGRYEAPHLDIEINTVRGRDSINRGAAAEIALDACLNDLDRLRRVQDQIDRARRGISCCDDGDSGK
ncbi:hypothetical protein [Sphingomonas crocodyli]|uniref:Uncharacterized protein n=1 Tax=Sphingomonas crocodyli TaxID=1979270 RepID=A0A437M7Z0_9SPHN|nr:hypothetical protein [Sphingomonas crocodyli]RVT93686.1 hypothetical protein EOD43_07415 [Sphingomonas crocodyli]